MSSNKRAIVLAGGWAHDPGPVIAAAEWLVVPRGFEPLVVTEPADLPAVLGGGCDLLVVGSCWFSMTDDRYTPEQRRAHAVRADATREALLDRLRARGCPLLALHTAVISFDGMPGWRRWLGGTWNWATSWHPPPGEVVVNAVAGSPMPFDTFTVVDEEYQGVDVDAGAELVATSAAGHPLVWLDETSSGRAAVNLLGHDSRSLDDPAHRRINGRLLDWLLASAGDLSSGTAPQPVR